MKVTETQRSILKRLRMASVLATPGRFHESAMKSLIEASLIEKNNHPIVGIQWRITPKGLEVLNGDAR